MKSISAIVAALKEACLERGFTFATAESCTGGLVGGAITGEPGISACYLGGVVSYANEAKRSLLGVPRELLGRVGAVSPECAAKMAEGVRRKFRSDLSVAVTGLAGPGGGTAGKPVGLVYVATSSRNGTAVTRNLFSGDRAQIRRAAVRKALERLVAEATGHF